MEPTEIPNVDVTITMKLSEIDYIFSLITEKPYKEVGYIVDKMRGQVLPQIPQSTSATPSEEIPSSIL